MLFELAIKSCRLKSTGFYFYISLMNPAEQYILEREEPFRTMLLQVQLLVESTLPDLVMLYKYKIPFFYIDGKLPFCYLNQTKNYVDVAFWHGTHLTRNLEYLVSEGRKHMKSLRYYSLDDIDAEVLIDVLNEAYSFRDKKYYK